MKCKYCKRQIPDESIYCMFCGEKVIKSKKKKAEVKVPKPRQLPSGSWFAQLTVNGERVSVSAATEAEYYTMAKAVKLGLIKAEKKAPALSLGKAIDDYIDSKRNVLSPSTILGYEKMRKNRFQAYMDKDIYTINWQQAVNEEATICSAKTLKNAWSMISSSIKAAHVEPSSVTLPQVVPNEHPYLSPDQIPYFVKALDGKDCKLPALLALNGLRQSELLALTWDHVDLKAKTMLISGAMVYDSNYNLVHKDTNKNLTSRRTVPIMLPELLSELEGVKDKTGFVVSMSPSVLYKSINRICKSSGLPQVGVHGLRHSFASLCHHLRVPELIAMQFGGWSTPDVLRDVYTHIPQSDIDNNAGKIINFFEGKAQIANENTNEFKKA